MGFDINRFKKDCVKGDFICTICQDVFNNPIMIEKCEHIFCDQCIREWIKEKKECPIDREPVSDSQLRGAFRAFNNLLNDLEIRCDYVSNGCSKFIKLEHLRQHCIICEYNPENGLKIKCDCNKEFKEKDVVSHQENCPQFLKETLRLTQLQLTSITQYVSDLNNDQMERGIANKNDTELKLVKQFEGIKLDINNKEKLVDQILVFLSWLYSNKINSSTIWNNLRYLITDQFKCCSRFLELNGLEYFVLFFNAFPEDADLHFEMLAAMVSIRHCYQLVPKLLDNKQCIEIFIELMHSEDFRVSFQSVGILSYICAEFPYIWCRKMQGISLQSILTKVKEVVSKYKINENFNFYYSSFNETFGILKSKSLPPELRFRLLWVLAFKTRADCAMYCPLIEKENGIEVIENIVKDRTTKFYVMKIAKLVLFQYEKYKACGNLRGIKGSDEMDVDKLAKI